MKAAVALDEAVVVNGLEAMASLAEAPAVTVSVWVPLVRPVAAAVRVGVPALVSA